jgi:serine/threonine protein phosphatase 1
MARTFVIGDIHGGLKALIQVIDLIQLKRKDTIIFLGDYVDGWSDSATLIEYLNELDKTYSCIFIKGNHDLWCEAWLNNELPNPHWLHHGGKSTVESYDGFTHEQKAEHLAFFNRMRNYYIDEQNRLFVHAGFSSMHGPSHEAYESNFYWDRTLWEVALTMDPRLRKDSELYPKRLLLFDEIYIGHTPTTNYNVYTPMQACNVWNMDTGAAYNGKLSVLDINTKQVWQSDPVQHLYPNEKGRNK